MLAKLFTKHEHRERLFCGAALLAISGLGFWLRIATASESLWLDELHTSWTVSASLAEVATRARLGNNHPLYFYLVRMIVHLCGHHEWSLRLPSIVCGTTLIPMAYGCARHWGWTGSASLLVAALIAVDEHCLYFSREARPYAILQLLALASFVTLRQRRHSRHSGWRMAWIGLVTLSFYLHYTAALFAVAQVVVAIVAKLTLPRKIAHQSGATVGDGTLSLRELFADVFVICACCLPALPHLWQVAARRENWEQFITRSPLSAIGTIYPLDKYWHFPIVMLAIRCCWQAIHWVRDAYRPYPNNPGQRANTPSPAATSTAWPTAAALCAWLFLTLSIAWLSTWLDVARLFFRRYVIAVAIVPAFISGWLWQISVRRIPPAAKWLTGVAMLLIAFADIGPFGRLRSSFELATHNHENWRAAVTAIDDPAVTDRSNWPVWVRSGLIEADAWYDASDERKRDYCLLPVLGIYRPRPEHPLLALPNQSNLVVSADAIRQAHVRGGVWLVIRAREQIQRATLANVKRQLATPAAESSSHSWKVVVDQRWGRLQLLALEVKP